MKCGFSLVDSSLPMNYCVHVHNAFSFLSELVTLSVVTIKTAFPQNSLLLCLVFTKQRQSLELPVTNASPPFHVINFTKQ